MSETLSERPAELEPGTVIEFGDISDLPAFEDIIAPFVEPELDKRLWTARLPVNEALRPRINGRLFYGRLGDITLTVMPEPYERLLDARERGWKIKRAQSFSSTERNIALRTQHGLGFEFSAKAFSSAQVLAIGVVTAELWYMPPRRDLKGKALNYTQSTASKFSEPIVRIVTYPKFEAGKFIELDERSQRVGFEVLQHSLRHPFRG